MIKRYVNAMDSGAGGTPNTFFAPTTFISGSATDDHETAHLTGVAGATLTLQITQYLHTNSNGHVQINFIELFEGMTFTVTLDGSGNGSFDAYLFGNAGDSNTIVLQKITIIGMTAGFPSSPINFQISKVF